MNQLVETIASKYGIPIFGNTPSKENRNKMGLNMHGNILSICIVYYLPEKQECVYDVLDALEITDNTTQIIIEGWLKTICSLYRIPISVKNI